MATEDGSDVCTVAREIVVAVIACIEIFYECGASGGEELGVRGVKTRIEDITACSTSCGGVVDIRIRAFRFMRYSS